MTHREAAPGESEKTTSEGRAEDRSARFRNTAALCLNIVSNVAIYRAGWKGREGQREPRLVDSRFWRQTNANAIDRAALDWCKVFVDRTAYHRWQRVIVGSDEERITASLHDLRGGQEAYSGEAQRIKAYRDKYVAHLDRETELFNPTTPIMKDSASLIYAELLGDPEALRHLMDAPPSIEMAYNAAFAEADEVLSAAERRAAPDEQ